MEDLSLHMLDMAENAVDAGAKRVEIEILEDSRSDRLTLSIKDDGRGMEEDFLRRVSDPLFSGKKSKRFGLGIPLLAQAAAECDGNFSITSEPGKGTSILAAFRLSHIDRKPLGDVGATMAALIGGHPEMDFLLRLERDGSLYIFDTERLRGLLEGVPLSTPVLLKLIKDDINEAIKAPAEMPG